jgi:hypothetical protein
MRNYRWDYDEKMCVAHGQRAGRARALGPLVSSRRLSVAPFVRRYKHTYSMWYPANESFNRGARMLEPWEVQAKFVPPESAAAPPAPLSAARFVQALEDEVGPCSPPRGEWRVAVRARCGAVIAGWACRNGGWTGNSRCRSTRRTRKRSGVRLSALLRQETNQTLTPECLGGASSRETRVPAPRR